MSELLDKYCKKLYGHTDWETKLVNGNVVVTFYAQPRAEYLEHNDIDEDDES